MYYEKYYIIWTIVFKVIYLNNHVHMWILALPASGYVMASYSFTIMFMNLLKYYDAQISFETNDGWLETNHLILWFLLTK